ASGGLPPERVLDLVDGLVAKSILIPETLPGRVRYRLLETIAEHGRESLTALGDEAVLRDRHAEHYGELARRAGSRFWTREQQAWLRRTRSDHANLVLAFEHLADPVPTPAALELATALRFYWVTGGVLREGRRWLERALRLPQEAVRPALRAEALWTCAWVAVLQGDYPAAARCLADCEELAATDALPAAAAHAATWRGTLALFTGDLDRALMQFSAAAQVHQQANDVEGALMTLFQWGITASLQGDSPTAQHACATAIALSREVGETFAGSYANWVLAHDAWSRGDLDTAQEQARTCLRLKYEIADYIGI